MKTPYPKKAFILAAGFGTRLLPLSLVRPKPLMPLWGTPMLEHVIRMLTSWGVEELIINLHHQADQLVQFVRTLPLPNVQIRFSREKEILGTGGALAHARKHLGDAPFWLLNADVAASVNPEPFVRAFQRVNPLAVLWMNDHFGPRTVRMKNRRITNFHVPHPGARGTFTFCGLHLISPEILQWIPPAGFSSIIDAYQRAMAENRTILGLNPRSVFWSDIGTPAQYLDAHANTAAAHTHGEPGGEFFDPHFAHNPNAAQRHDGLSAVDPTAAIGRSCLIRDSLVWDHAHLVPQVHLHRCIVAGSAAVHHPGRYENTLFTPASDVLTAPEKRSAARHLRGEITVESLPPRGSNRSFARLTTAHDSLILIRYDDQARPENLRYAGHTRRLEQCGIPVPRVLAHSAKNHFMLMEDGGREDLTRRMVSCSNAEAMRLYRRVIDAVLRLHNEGTRRQKLHPIPLEPAFDTTLYRWEHELFFNEFAAPRVRLTVRQRSTLTEEFSLLARTLLAQPPVLIHRDLQSSNVLLNKTRLVLIDYQGMRLGAAAYDLASLLYDPYVDLPDALRLQLLEYYNRKTSGAPIPNRIFYAGAAQRLIQALGAYGRLGKMPGTARFSAYIQPALQRLSGVLSHFPELTKSQDFTQSLASC